MYGLGVHISNLQQNVSIFLNISEFHAFTKLFRLSTRNLRGVVQPTTLNIVYSVTNPICRAQYLL